MTRRIGLVWQCAVDAATALTTPKPDVAASDRSVDCVLRDSRLFGAIESAAEGGRRAWPHARTRAWWVSCDAEWTRWSATERVRAIGLFTLVAGVTALLVQMTNRTPGAALAGVLPAAIAGLGLLIFLAAAPLARALADKTS